MHLPDPWKSFFAEIDQALNQIVGDDVKHLARVVPFDLEILRSRFEDELKPYLGNPQRESLTLKLWIDAIEEERASASVPALSPTSK
jgi:hypothetical protein